MNSPVLKKRWLIFLTTAVIFAAGFALLSRKIPGLVEQRIRNDLAVYGVDNFRLGEPYWGLKGAGTSELRISGQYEDWQFSATLHNVQATYHWRTLLDGEIHNLAVDSISATLTHKPAAKDTPEEPFQVATLLESLEALHLPVEQVSIGTLGLALALEGGTLAVEGEDIRLNNGEQAVTGLFSVIAEARGDGAWTGVMPGIQLDAVPGDFAWLPALTISLARDDEVPFLQGNLALKEHGIDSQHPENSTNPNGRALVFSGNLKHQDIASLASPPAMETSGSPADSALPSGKLAAEITAQGSISIPDEVILSRLSLAQTPLTGEARGQLHADAMPAAGIENTSWTFHLGVASTGKTLSLAFVQPLVAEGFLDGSYWRDEITTFGWTSPVPFRLTATSAEPFFTLKSLAPAGEGSNILITLEVAEGQQALSAEATLGKLALDGSDMAADLEARMTMPYGGKQLPPIAFSSNLSHSGGTLAFAGDFALADWDIDGHFQGTYVDDAFNARADARLANLPVFAAQWDEYDIYDGDIALVSGKGNARISLRQPPGKDGGTAGALVYGYEIAAENISGMVDGIAVSGVELSLSLADDGAWRSTKPLVIHAETISSGVAISSLAANLDLRKSPDFDTTHWRLNSLKGELFSGTLSLAQPANIDFPFAGNSLTILLSNLRLQDILRLYEEQGVSGTGTISGEIPLVLEKDGLRINNGKLESVEAGSIVFTSGKAEAMKATSEQLAMALRLLENFNYQTLAVTTGFEPTGDMKLGVQLSGSNPAEFDGRQVNFNINLEENLYDLFKVLKLTDDITRQIEKRLQKQGRH